MLLKMLDVPLKNRIFELDVLYEKINVLKAKYEDKIINKTDYLIQKEILELEIFKLFNKNL